MSGKGVIAGDLASVFQRLVSDECSLQPFLPLITLVTQQRQAADPDIWRAVLDLLSSLLTHTTTPPPSIPIVPPTFDATPRSFTSASQQGSEQTRKLVEPPLRHELKDCCFQDVGGLLTKYFENKDWSSVGDKIITAVGTDLQFPVNPTEEEVWKWINAFQERHLPDKQVRGRYYTTRSKADLTGDAERQLDVFTKSCEAQVPTTSSTNNQHDWADVRVVGELQKSTDKAQKFFQLARYVRDVFAAQPTRRYVHGFILSGTVMEVHVFDRSGGVSTKFDILQEPTLFLRVLTGYAMMSDEELGLDTFIEKRGNRMFVTIELEDDTRRRLELETCPIARQSAIVSRATSVYRTVDGRLAIKFSWQPKKKVSEVQHLKAASGVPGVTQLVASGQITSIVELRKGLTLDKRRHIRAPLSRTGSSFSQALTTSFSGLGSSQGSKRKKSKTARGSSSPRKRARSGSQASGLSQEQPASQESLTILPELEEDESFQDRVLNYLVISPTGRPLSDFDDVPELLCALRDAIKAHRSLFEARVLHRDISKHNIIITDPTGADGYSGVLIDLDMATRINADGTNEGSGAQQMTGTLEFMAIEVLRSAARDVQHTYRHDLESFFYVFLSVCVNDGWPERRRPRVSPLQGWYTLPCENIAALKRGHMEPGGFEDIVLPKFSPRFADVKGLARNLRDALFSIGKLFTGTPRDHRPLYKSMIDAFDEAISSLI